jgi:hypothetical protein
LHLSREIERQGVSRKVAADMFGMALRGYQRKVQRLTESSSTRGHTLWEAILNHIEQHKRSTRIELMRHFEADGEDHVAAVLRDLRDSGMIFSMGRGDSTLYGLSSRQDRARMLEQGRSKNIASVVWFLVYRKPRSINELALETKVDKGLLRTTVATLLAQGVIQIAAEPGDTKTLEDATLLRSGRFLIPMGARSGWEIAVFDHFRAVAAAIASKLQGRLPGHLDRGIFGDFEIRDGDGGRVCGVHPNRAVGDVAFAEAVAQPPDGSLAGGIDLSLRELEVGRQAYRGGLLVAVDLEARRVPRSGDGDWPGFGFEIGVPHHAVQQDRPCFRCRFEEES